jgi:hypothetical protein
MEEWKMEAQQEIVFCISLFTCGTPPRYFNDSSTERPLHTTRNDAHKERTISVQTQYSQQQFNEYARIIRGRNGPATGTVRSDVSTCRWRLSLLDIVNVISSSHPLSTETSRETTRNTSSVQAHAWWQRGTSICSPRNV